MFSPLTEPCNGLPKGTSTSPQLLTAASTYTAGKHPYVLSYISQLLYLLLLKSGCFHLFLEQIWSFEYFTAIRIKRFSLHQKEAGVQPWQHHFLLMPLQFLSYFCSFPSTKNCWSSLSILLFSFFFKPNHLFLCRWKKDLCENIYNSLSCCDNLC